MKSGGSVFHVEAHPHGDAGPPDDSGTAEIAGLVHRQPSLYGQNCPVGGRIDRKSLLIGRSLRTKQYERNRR
ncbi:hypothetical protein CEP50_03940 [Actinopolyspora mortivallis]|uniref:Uncharacterized protein n=1 Tax=Actinopolyspora mortivallis TaxID=33906 RepID=A0A2T0GZI5_ACTMO|nr:hypothetical protein CEP50_03940 [Actinopolyspora mortivallis]